MHSLGRHGAHTFFSFVYNTNYNVHSWLTASNICVIQVLALASLTQALVRVQLAQFVQIEMKSDLHGTV